MLSPEQNKSLLDTIEYLENNNKTEDIEVLKSILTDQRDYSNEFKLLLKLLDSDK